MTPEPTDRRATLAAELAETARALSESDLIKAHPADAHGLFQDLHTAIDSLKQVTVQLSWSHSRAVRWVLYYSALTDFEEHL